MKRQLLAWVGFAAFPLFSGCGGGGGPPGECVFGPIACGQAGQPARPPDPSRFAIAGMGPNVFRLPAAEQRYLVEASTAERLEVFAFRVDGLVRLSALVGQAESPPNVSGVYLLPAGGLVEITSATRVSWSFRALP